MVRATAPSASLSSTASGGGGGGGGGPGPARSFSLSLSLQSAASAMHHPPLSSAPSSSAAVMSFSSPSASPVSLSSSLGPHVEEARRCRYKTGKCSNARSSKRNGQPHQLCLYHRDKANQIQRKFDRQKRQVLRERKSCSPSPTSSHASASGSALRHSYSSTQSLASLHRSHLQVHYSQQQQFRHTSPLNSSSASQSSVHNVTNFAPRFTSLAAKDLDLYSDSDASSRFSTDSSSSDASSSLWADLPSPVSATAFMGLLRLTPVAAPTPTSTSAASPSVASTPDCPQFMVTPTATSASAQGHLSHDEIDFLCSAMLE